MRIIDDFYDIYGYYFVPFYRETWFFVFVSMFIFSLLIVAAWFLWKWWSKRQDIKKTLSPWEWAFEELNKLSISQCESREDFRNFYFLLTDLVKEYLHRCYGWKLDDKTDDEFVAYLEDHDFSFDLVRDLRKILKNALFVKYAGQDALRSQAEEAIDLIVNLVEKTRQ